MKEIVTNLIQAYVDEYPHKNKTKTSWRKPLVGFAAVDNPIIKDLKNIIIETHYSPEEILEKPRTIISYFIPFKEELGNSNLDVVDDYASLDWAIAYEETNKMMLDLNEYLIEELKKLNYRAAYPKVAGIISEEVLYSNWSQRHIAYCAGLGTFGINNMLIGPMGCCGRYNSIVTDLDVVPDKPLQEENCLYKKNGSCGVCLRNCYMNALSETGFKREICNIAIDRNAEKYGRTRSSCGKCVVGLPCTYRQP